MAENNYVVINKAGCIHNCHTKERYDAFIKAGWKDYKASGDDLSALKKDDLLKKAAELGLEGVTDKMNKDEIIRAIKEHQKDN